MKILLYPVNNPPLNSKPSKNEFKSLIGLDNSSIVSLLGSLICLPLILLLPSLVEVVLSVMTFEGRDVLKCSRILLGLIPYLDAIENNKSVGLNRVAKPGAYVFLFLSNEISVFLPFDISISFKPSSELVINLKVLYPTLSLVKF